MTDLTEVDKIADRTAVVRAKRFISICTECEHFNGCIIANVGDDTENETISGYICKNPAVTGANGKEISVNNPLKCAYKHRNIWAYDTREELYNENQMLKEEIKRLRYKLGIDESKIFERDEEIEKLRTVIKGYELETLKDEKEKEGKEILNTHKEAKYESNPWDI